MATEYRIILNLSDAKLETAAEGLQQPAEAVTRAIDLLGNASDAHAWRARSFARALVAISEADDIEPAALAAIADALQEHIIGLTDAVDEAHALLCGKASASAERQPAA